MKTYRKGWMKESPKINGYSEHFFDQEDISSVCGVRWRCGREPMRQTPKPNACGNCLRILAARKKKKKGA